ncbi:hypothetical protein DB347_02090 [Opitutaceae bacterium EW11]|nr:hypothetical protein DB347_02090 [Opitutaceae bacterium EW11]
MLQDLLAVADHEPPMGDLCTRCRLDAGRAIWTTPLPEEDNLPSNRIVHQRIVRLHGRACLHRLGLQRGPGYHKCGSRQDHDWVAALRVLAFQAGRWREICHRRGLRPPVPGSVEWIPLPQIETSGVILEIRQSGIDGGWTPWNLAMSAFVLEGELLEPLAPRKERLLRVSGIDVKTLPRGVSAVVEDGAVRYGTRDFEVGFVLGRPGFSHLGLSVETPGVASPNLLATRPPQFFQGPQLHLLGTPPSIAPTTRCDLDGTVQVLGATVRYLFSSGGQRYRIVWRVAPSGLRLELERFSKKAALAWHSAAWVIGLRNSATPSHVLGRPRTVGETGGIELPALLNLPGCGTWRIASTRSAAWARSDCWRSQDLNTLELKVGETATPEGLYFLAAGRHRAVVTLRPAMPKPSLRPGAPRSAQRALARTQWTALTFRADTGTLSNNGASIHCPICMDTWSAVSLRLGPVLPGLPAGEFLRFSLERWLTGGPGYAAGRLVEGGSSHDADDEYLMTGASALRGLGDYLRNEATPAWFREFRPWILSKLNAARGRDLDADGLIESPFRTGVSGTAQWSTCWFDVISFGWKDAFANAILYGALNALTAGLRRFGERDEAAGLSLWATTLRRNFRRTFWNDATGWLAGWRCKEGRLHDYAFLPVNGAAVAEGLLDTPEARRVMSRLLAEAKLVGMPDPVLGLPGNLRPIPDDDLADIAQGYPFGYYQNGGRTHAQARHFVMGLYHCGLTREADRILERLCAGLAGARVFGGNKSGVDWRHWDDRPCGYEGLLTDQFGVLEPVLWRWGRRHARAKR